jgi:hypothetical protein
MKRKTRVANAVEIFHAHDDMARGVDVSEWYALQRDTVLAHMQRDTISGKFARLVIALDVDPDIVASAEAALVFVRAEQRRLLEGI